MAMNYLGHLYFSDSNSLAWAGALMGDFVKGSNFMDMPNSLVRHIRLHRFIDGYTLKDPFFKQSCDRLDPSLRLARGIVVDVFYDHFLACHWEDFSKTALAAFSATVYAGLKVNEDLLNPALKQQLPRMIKYDWLTSYQHPEVVVKVLKSLEERLHGKFLLTRACVTLESCREELEHDFFQFMHAAKLAVACWKEEYPEELVE
jgi:acyl carrier protein phosphodiesterase